MILWIMRRRRKAGGPDESEIPLRRKDVSPAGGQGRSPQGKMFVAGAVELSPEGHPGRIRLAPIADFSAATLGPFVAATAAPGARVVTDGWSGYAGLSDHAHHPTVVGKMAAHVVLKWSHRVFSNLKTWALGTFHGQHMKRDLDELVFRWNRRRHTATAFDACSASASASPPQPPGTSSRSASDRARSAAERRRRNNQRSHVQTAAHAVPVRTTPAPSPQRRAPISRSPGTRGRTFMANSREIRLSSTPGGSLCPSAPKTSQSPSPQGP
jgi:hypothetical protein